jgi:hypothetical protein
MKAITDFDSPACLPEKELSNTLTTDFCLDAVQETIARHGCPGDLQH